MQCNRQKSKNREQVKRQTDRQIGTRNQYVSENKFYITTKLERRKTPRRDEVYVQVQPQDVYTRWRERLQDKNDSH